MRTEHTPGPWKVHNRDIRSGEKTILTATIWNEKADQDLSLAASAPDMLAALDRLNDLLINLNPFGHDPHTTIDEALVITQSAIAKAEGRTL